MANRKNVAEQYEKDKKKLGARVADALYDENVSQRTGQIAIGLRGAHAGHVDPLWRRQP